MEHQSHGTQRWCGWMTERILCYFKAEDLSPSIVVTTRQNIHNSVESVVVGIIYKQCTAKPTDSVVSIFESTSQLPKHMSFHLDTVSQISKQELKRQKFRCMSPTWLGKAEGYQIGKKCLRASRNGKTVEEKKIQHLAECPAGA